MPKAVGGRNWSPHASHSTANTELKRALQDGQRQRISPAHCGHSVGNPLSDSSK
ncbi:MAG: hypothetical protein AABM30_12765 [Actinomycetota bacterium]